MLDTATRRLLVAMMILVLAGCRAEMSDGQAPKLLNISKEDYAAKKAAREAKRKRFQKELNADLEDPIAFASSEMVETFVEECRVRPVKPAAEKGLSAGKGLLWKGTAGSLMGEEAPANGEFNWIEGDSEFMDPNRVSESAGNSLASQMFEPLMVIAPDNGPPRYGAAESYTLSEDGKTYTFKLRKGLVWSDGVPLTAEDFRYSWLRGLSPELGSRNAQQIWNFVKGARAYNRGDTKDGDSVAIKVLGEDKLTLQVELLYPTPFFLDLVTYIAYTPVPRHAIEKHGDRWTRPENIVVNGPYVMKEWRPRARMVFEKNPRYWDAANVEIRKHTAFLTASEEANVTYYMNGQVQTSQPLPEEKIKNWIKDSALDLKIAEQMGTYYYVFRTDRPPFNNRLLRKAFNKALDKERLTSFVLSGFKPPARSLLPDVYADTQVGYQSMPGDHFDPVEASALMDKAGYPGGKGLGKLDLIYNTYETHKKIAVFYQRNMKDNLGVDITLNNMEWKSLLKQVQTGDFQIARTSWIADYPDPLTFLQVWHSESANNYAAYKNPAYDDLLLRIKQTTDQKKRNTLICAAERVINYDVPISPIYFYARPYLIHPSVKGYHPQYQDHHLIKYISYKR
jgi:oligopeptide transport system substrate-binding protein